MNYNLRARIFGGVCVLGVYIEKHWSEHRSQTINQEMAFAPKSWLQNKTLPFISIALDYN